MKLTTLRIIIGVALYVLAFHGSAYAYYQTVDNLLLTYSGATSTATKNGDIYYKQVISICNTGTEDLADVGVLWRAVISGSAFTYDNGNHRWERELTVGGVDYGLHWVEGYSYDPIHETSGVNSYLEIGTVGLMQQSTSAFDRATSILSATDEVPVYLLGDLAAGEESVFSLYFAQNSSTYTGGGWGVQPVFSCIASVSQVPLPSAMLLLGSGIGIVGWIKSRSQKYRA